MIWQSYAVLALATAAYWFVIGAWLDRRIIDQKPPTHSRAVKIVARIFAVPTLLLFILFLGKDIFAGWQEGPNGAYGITAWLAVALAVLATEIGLFSKVRT